MKIRHALESLLLRPWGTVLPTQLTYFGETFVTTSWNNINHFCYIKVFIPTYFTVFSSCIMLIKGFKARVRYFHQIFIFSPNDSPSNYEKCFSFHLKSSFRSWDIQFFVFLSFPLFLPVGHCFRGWSKINLKVYDVINCLNKNSITRFVWYLEKEKRYGIKTLSIDGVSDKKHFYRKIMQKMYSNSQSQTSL